MATDSGPPSTILKSRCRRCALLVVVICLIAFMLLAYYMADPERIPSIYKVSALSGTEDRGRQFHLAVEDGATARPAATKVGLRMAPIGLQHVEPRDKTASVSSPLSEAEVAARFQSRLRTLQVACGKYSNSSDFRPIKRKNYRIDALPPVWNHKLSYCPIQKTSSTTWTGILRSMLNEIRKDYHQAKSGQGAKVSQPSQEKPHEVRFTFVREPYGRLLSAYVDKLFSPNTVFWRTHGRYIVEHFRPNASQVSLTCGHDVTFPEFVQFFILMQTTGMKRDGHFFPTHDHCQMCNQPPFHYIGHLETLKEDMPFILKAVHSPVSYDKTFDNVTISGNINMVIRRMRNKVLQCMGLDEACRRLWKKWQIRGIISKTIPFPLTKEETRDISVQRFQDVALSALGTSGEKSSRTPQKREALMEAFASVSLEDRLKVKRLLFLDFQMFGFPSEPDEVFSSGSSNEDEGGFRYFDLYK